MNDDEYRAIRSGVVRGGCRPQCRLVQASPRVRGRLLPDEPPHEFAIVTRGGAELMLQRVARGEKAGPVNSNGWSVYLRLSGEGILQLLEQIQRDTPVLAGPWRKFYGDVEFEIADPDGHRLCLGELLPESIQLPSPKE